MRQDVTQRADSAGDQRNTAVIPRKLTHPQLLCASSRLTVINTTKKKIIKYYKDLREYDLTHHITAYTFLLNHI